MLKALSLSVLLLVAFAVSDASAEPINSATANQICSGQDKTIILGCRTPDGGSCVSCKVCLETVFSKKCVYVGCNQSGCDAVVLRRIGKKLPSRIQR